MDTANSTPPRPTLSVEQVLTAAIMALIVLITLANVVVRYLTAYSFAFTEEFSVTLLVALALLGSTAAFAAGRHIRITFFVERLPASWRPACEQLALTATALLFGLLTVLGGRLAWDDFRFEVTSPGLGVPQWLYTVWLPILALWIAARVLAALWRLIRAGRS